MEDEFSKEHARLKRIYDKTKKKRIKKKISQRLFQLVYDSFEDGWV